MSEITNAIRAIGRGEVVIATDDERRENEGDLIMAAEAVTTDALAFFLEHTSGVICATLHGERLDELELPPMVRENREGHRTAFTLSVDLASGITTGISASDRARTVRALADPHAVASDFVRPGHIFPLRSRSGGVLERPGHTEAGVDLARLAGLQPAAIICEVVTPDRRAMARRPELEALARAHGLPMISIAELMRHRRRSERLIDKVAEAPVPTPHGTFTCQAWRSLIDGVDHIAFVRGDVSGDEPVLVRVHSECLTGDVFGSRRCDCGSQLADALDAIDEAGRGVLVYLRGHEGRGIGIASKLDAYRLQDGGHDTVDANLHLGLPVDGREYGTGAQILSALGIERVRLITNNPAKCEELGAHGIEVEERVALQIRPTPENITYLETKRRRMGHLLGALESNTG
jgi:3,4-dihydroxy 2-butanone 4-phosphate synthase / GTP cyclohydrolase II